MLKNRNIVTFHLLGQYGRLCNQMYQIAGTIGIARKNSYAFAFPYWKNYDHQTRFGSTEDIDIQKYFIHPLPIYNGPKLPDYFVHWGYHDIILDRSVSIQGHLQSLKYFGHCYDEVAWYFTMKDEYPASDAIALHCRLGDYDNGYHPRLGLSYYSPALEHFPKNHPVIVFSDDIKATQKMFTGKRFSFYDSDYIDSFKKMKSCRHFIIGNSTFSSMAAVLGEAKDKKVIAPEPWFGPKYTNITGKDIYNDDWTIIHYENTEVTA